MGFIQSSFPLIYFTRSPGVSDCFSLNPPCLYVRLSFTSVYQGGEVKDCRYTLPLLAQIN
jgi:hypothetical protein